VKSGDVVVDLGARHVYAIEMSGIADAAAPFIRRPA
jgi:hypothetical protein